MLRSHSALVVSVLFTLSLAACGEGVGPRQGSDLIAEPGLVDFGYVSALQFSEEVVIELTNEGGQDVEIEAIRISTEGGEAFNLQLVPAQLPLRMGPNATESISVYFAPPSSAMFLGWVEVITDNDTVLVALGGCSTGSDCVVEFEDPPGDDDDDDASDDDDATTGTPDINFNPGSVNFGSIPQNQAAVGDVVTVSNTGDGPLDIESVTLSSSTGDDAYFSVAGFSSGTLQPSGAPINLNVTFDPYGAPEGAMNAEITVVSNDPDEGNVTIPLSVTVTEDCVGCPAILQVAGSVPLDLLLAQITYVQVSTGTTTVDISNVGEGALQVEPITEGGTMCPDFAPISYVSSTSSSLAPGESATLTFSVGQAGIDVINLGSGDTFTVGTLAADFDSVFNWGIENCSFALPGFP